MFINSVFRLFPYIRNPRKNRNIYGFAQNKANNNKNNIKKNICNSKSFVLVSNNIKLKKKKKNRATPPPHPPPPPFVWYVGFWSGFFQLWILPLAIRRPCISYSNTATPVQCLILYEHCKCTCIAFGITKTYLYNSDPLKPHFYIVKLGLQEYTLFFISEPKHRLWVLVRTSWSWIYKCPISDHQENMPI